MARSRRVVVHLQVPYLVVPRRWRVGAATFWPGGSLLERLRRQGGTARRPLPPPVLDYVTDALRGNRWSTVRTDAMTTLDGRGKEDLQATVSAARDSARDSISVLTLFKLASHRYLNTEIQTFGLALDVASIREDYWVTTTRGRYLMAGSARHGTLAPWEFQPADIARYQGDPRFRLLDIALRTPDDQRTDWQRRVLAALRTLTVTNTTDRPSTRIVLAATALEALVGDEFQPDVRQNPTGSHQLARRAAFLWCGAEHSNPHGPNRPACPFLTEPSDRRLTHRLAEDARHGQRWVCDYYADLRDLYDDRSAALHGAEVRFTDSLASRHEFTVERILLLVLEWIVATGATTLHDYEAAIATVPRP
jgi:hypothetical protein